eukprot:scpid48353/ scgid7175/ 
MELGVLVAVMCIPCSYGKLAYDMCPAVSFSQLPHHEGQCATQSSQIFPPGYVAKSSPAIHGTSVPGVESENRVCIMKLRDSHKVDLRVPALSPRGSSSQQRCMQRTWTGSRAHTIATYTMLLNQLLQKRKIASRTSAVAFMLTACVGR